MTEQKFKVGDRVRFAGTEGVVTVVSGYNHGSITEPKYLVKFGEHQLSFMEDGDYYPGGIFLDRLTLIERPKNLVKKTLWAAIYNDLSVSVHLHETKEKALAHRGISIGAVAVEVEISEDGME
jgi:hypothetical protein